MLTNVSTSRNKFDALQNLECSKFANKCLSWSPFSTAVYCTGSGVEHRLRQSNFSDLFLSLLLVTPGKLANSPHCRGRNILQFL